MSIEERVRLCRIIEKMEDCTEYSQRLGLENKSSFRKKALREMTERGNR